VLTILGITDEKRLQLQANAAHSNVLKEPLESLAIPLAILYFLRAKRSASNSPSLVQGAKFGVRLGPGPEIEGVVSLGKEPFRSVQVDPGKNADTALTGIPAKLLSPGDSTF